MGRIGLAFSCFFRLLFGGKLPPAAAAYLPPGAAPAPALPAASPGPTAAPVATAAAPEPAKPKRESQHAQRDGALALLALLQREGRLIDFARESLDGFSDADIGAAARDVHRGCKKVLDQHVTLAPIVPGAEDEPTTIPLGFDPTHIRVIGEAKGEPPWKGTLRHPGWRATAVTLPTLVDGVDRTIVAPAEVDVGA
jgi:hypothetical protein